MKSINMSTPSKPSPSFPLPLGEGQGEGKQPTITSGKPSREISFAQAINEALAEEMRRDPRSSSSARMSPKLELRSKCSPAW